MTIGEIILYNEAQKERRRLLRIIIWIALVLMIAAIKYSFS